MNISNYFKNNNPNIDKRITLYTNLKVLNLRMCDFIPDEILFILKLCRYYINIENYYGEEII